MSRSRVTARSTSADVVTSEASLFAAESSLTVARQTVLDAEALVSVRKKQVVDAHETAMLQANFQPRRLLVAYALWLFTPLAWPGAYLFYLGRDVHAAVQTVTFGGFGVGWLLDGLLMPLYVADINEPVGYLERAERRHASWWTLSTLLLPVALVMQLAVGLYFGCIAYHLVPTPLVMPVELSGGAVRWSEPLSESSTGLVTFAAGMLGAALGVRITAAHVGGKVRLRIKARHLATWCVGAGALVLGNGDKFDDAAGDDSSVRWATQLSIGVVGAMAGAARGRAWAPTHASPRRVAQRYLSVRLALQLACIALFAAAAGGSFWLNGSYTHTHDGGKRETYSGAEVLPMGWKSLKEFGGDLKAAGSTAYAVYARKSWSEIWSEAQEAFKDPAREAAELLELPADASMEAIKKACWQQLPRRRDLG